MTALDVLRPATSKAEESLTYSYDVLSRLTQIADTNGPTVQNAYDAVGRLTSQTVTDGTTKQVTSFSYDPRTASSRSPIRFLGTTTFTYDIQGPMGLKSFLSPSLSPIPWGTRRHLLTTTAIGSSARADANQAVTQYG